MSMRSMVDRRTLVLGLSIAMLGIRLRASAQSTPELRRIGFLAFNAAATGGDVRVALRQSLGELGWVDGQNIVIETRFADGDVDRLPSLIDELLRLNVDVMVVGSSAATRASKAATATVPIVMLASADAFGEGFVASLGRPGGNITGMTLLAGPGIASKQLELLREIAHAATPVAALMNPLNGAHAAFAQELRIAARKFGTQLQSFRADSPKQLDDAFAAMAKERAAALIVLSDAMFFGERQRIVDLARGGRLPGMYGQREFVEAGGLASYGPSLVDMSRRAAKHVDKILRGAKPSSVPVEQPTKFELFINNRTAKALGITVPQSLLLRADEVIDR
jgi:putative tryptophan/tyrosine transport system substrate-binding protein